METVTLSDAERRALSDYLEEGADADYLECASRYLNDREALALWKKITGNDYEE